MSRWRWYAYFSVHEIGDQKLALTSWKQNLDLFGVEDVSWRITVATQKKALATIFCFMTHQRLEGKNRGVKRVQN